MARSPLLTTRIRFLASGRGRPSAAFGAPGISCGDAGRVFLNRCQHRARRAARGGDRGHPGAVERVSRVAPGHVLPRRGRALRPATRPAASDHGGDERPESTTSHSPPGRLVELGRLMGARLRRVLRLPPAPTRLSTRRNMSWICVLALYSRPGTTCKEASRTARWGSTIPLSGCGS